jgi:hypothetical protein
MSLHRFPHRVHSSVPKLPVSPVPPHQQTFRVCELLLTMNPY